MDRSSPLVGTFGTSEDGLSCTLTLELDVGGLLIGRLHFGELAFEVRGNLSRQANVAYGVVLEPTSAAPLALLRASVSGEEMALELDVATDPETLPASARFLLARLERGRPARA